MVLQLKGAMEVQQELYNNPIISFLFTFAYGNIYKAMITYYFFDKIMTQAKSTMTTTTTIHRKHQPQQGHFFVGVCKWSVQVCSLLLQPCC